MPLARSIRERSLDWQQAWMGEAMGGEASYISVILLPPGTRIEVT